MQQKCASGAPGRVEAVDFEVVDFGACLQRAAAWEAVLDVANPADNVKFEKEVETDSWCCLRTFARKRGLECRKSIPRK